MSLALRDLFSSGKLGITFSTIRNHEPARASCRGRVLNPNTSIKMQSHRFPVCIPQLREWHMRCIPDISQWYVCIAPNCGRVPPIRDEQEMKPSARGLLGIPHVLAEPGENERTGAVRFLVPCWRFQMVIMPAAPSGCRSVVQRCLLILWHDCAFYCCQVFMLLGRAGKGPALLPAFPVIGVSLFVPPPPS